MDSRQTEEPMLFGLSQFTTGDLPFEEYLLLVQACEVKSIEIAESKLSPIEGRARDQILELTESGITVSGVVPRVHALFPDTLNPKITDLQQRLDSFHASIDFFARALPGVGLPVLTITGAAPGVNLRDSYAYALRAYRELVQHAAAVGVRLMFEPLGPVLMNTDTFICTLYRAMELIERVDHPDFGLALDSWHVWDEPLLAERIVSAGDRIFGVQVSDYPRNEPRGYLAGSGVEVVRIEGRGVDQEAVRQTLALMEAGTPAIVQGALRVRFEIQGWGFAARRFVIQALDVDRAEPWPDGQDRQEDEALSVGFDGRGVGADWAADAQAWAPRPSARG